MKQKAVIIGGGFAGLATAALLGKQGYAVTLLEKNATLGGRARVMKKKGFTFDMGPSWYMMPEVFERYFAQFGHQPSDFYELVRLDPSYQVHFENNSSLTIPAQPDLVADIFEHIEAGAGQNFKTYLEKSRQNYAVATQDLMYQDSSQLKVWLNLKRLGVAFKLLFTSNILQSWSSQLRQIFKDERILKILSFPAVFLGGSPYITPSLFSILSWADFGKGIWYPVGGMGKVVSALQTLATEQQVKIQVKAEVSNVVIKDKKISEVIANGKRYSADVVVVAADMPHFETHLLPAQYQSYSSNYWKTKTMSISALMIYVGINKKLKKAVHHTLYFSQDWQRNFSDIFEKQDLPTNPSFYVSIRSVTDPGLTPANSEELVILVPVPANLHTTSDQYQQLANKVLTKLETLLGESLTDSLVLKELYTPNDFAEDYHAYQGTALGLAHTLDQSFLFRPGNRSKKLSNLYYAGQYTNPGVGVPIALASAELVSNLIRNS